MRSVVPPSLEGERADLILARSAGVSRATARRMIELGLATAGGGPVQAKQRLSGGTVLEFEVPEAFSPLEPEEVAFGVRYEDEFLAVVEKPAGITVHPGSGRRRGTLASGILQRWPQVEGVGDPGRWGLVHRLDRDTSGLLVVALEEAAFAGLRAAMGRREVTRRYLTLVHGSGISPRGTIEAPLGRDPRHPTRFRVDRSGRPARTHYRRLAAWVPERLALLEVTLETGRTHQVRVHAASIGHPVAGDPVYGRGGDGMPRLFLHATRLRFTHPITGAEIDAVSSLPSDLAGVLDSLGEPDVGDTTDRPGEAPGRGGSAEERPGHVE